MKTYFKFITALLVVALGTACISSFGVDLKTSFAVTVGVGLIPTVSGSILMATPSTDVAAIAKWAGMYSKTFINQVLNDLDIFKDLTVDRLVSRHGKLLPKFTAENGLRPLDPYLEETGKKERTWSGRKLFVYDCMKLFKIIPQELKESFQSDMLSPGATEMPFAKWVWEKEGEKLASEVNDNFYLSEYHADAAAWSAAATYTANTDYVKFEDNFYKCVTNTAAGESPTTHPAKWLEVNALVCFNGPGTIIAAEITAANLSPIATGAITSANAVTKVELMYSSMPVAVRKKGGKIRVSPDVFKKYLDHEKTVYPSALTQDMGDGKKYVYGSGKKWEIVEQSWMGSSQRIICDVQGKNMIVGTNLKDTPGITNTVQTLFGYKAASTFLMGFQISDLEVLFVNDQA